MSEHIHAFLSQWTVAERAGDAETLATLLTDDFAVLARSDSSSPGPHGWTAIAKAWPTSSSVSKRSRFASTATSLWSRPAMTPVAPIKVNPYPKRYGPRSSSCPNRKLCSWPPST